GLQSGLEYTGDELLYRRFAPSARTRDESGSTEKRERARPVGGRIGVHEAPANGAAVAHGAVGDVGSDLAHEAACRIGNASVLDLRVRDAGAKGHGLGAFLHGTQFFDVAQVDEER